jgi:hypothetical protein
LSQCAVKSEREETPAKTAHWRFVSPGAVLVQSSLEALRRLLREPANRSANGARKLGWAKAKSAGNGGLLTEKAGFFCAGLGMVNRGASLAAFSLSAC